MERAQTNAVAAQVAHPPYGTQPTTRATHTKITTAIRLVPIPHHLHPALSRQPVPVTKEANRRLITCSVADTSFGEWLNIDSSLTERNIQALAIKTFKIINPTDHPAGPLQCRRS